MEGNQRCNKRLSHQAPGYYGEVDDENSYKLLNKALDIGCNFWDTAGTNEGALMWRGVELLG